MPDSQAADLSLLRELNERIVLGLLRQEGPISRAELARRSNLSRSTISNIITNLLAAGLVREIGIGDSNGGRRPILVEFNYQSAYVVGIELGNTAMTLLLTDLAANVLCRAEQSFEIAAGPDVCLPRVAALVDDLLASGRISRGLIVGVGVGVPGPLAFANGRPMMPPGIPGWHGVPLRVLFEDALGLRVFVENDANLGALAEHSWGAARERFNIAYIYLGGTGIGCGLILDGRLYRGEVGSAGEIGHLMVEEDGPICRCGARGCLEAVASMPALLSRANALGLPARHAGDLIRLARAGQDQAAGLIEMAGEYLGAAIANILNMTNPGCIVIGGELSQAGDLLLRPLRRVMRRRGLAAAIEQAEIVPGRLGADVVAIGAVSIVVQHAFNMPALARAQSDIADQTGASKVKSSKFKISVETDNS